MLAVKSITFHSRKNNSRSPIEIKSNGNIILETLPP